MVQRSILKWRKLKGRKLMVAKTLSTKGTAIAFTFTVANANRA
jgi:hypothetical protein